MDLRQLLLRICAPILSQHANGYCINSSASSNQFLGLLNPRRRPQLLLCMFRALQRPEILHIIIGYKSTQRWSTAS